MQGYTTGNERDVSFCIEERETGSDEEEKTNHTTDSHVGIEDMLVLYLTVTLELYLAARRLVGTTE